MVLMAWSHLPSAPVYITKTIDARRLGPTQHSGKMSSPTITAHAAPKSEIGKRDSQLASNLGTEGATPQPPSYREHTSTTGLPTTVCARYGVFIIT